MIGQSFLDSRIFPSFVALPVTALSIVMTSVLAIVIVLVFDLATHGNGGDAEEAETNNI
jgi:hypothetical protein